MSRGAPIADRTNAYPTGPEGVGATTFPATSSMLLESESGRARDENISASVTNSICGEAPDAKTGNPSTRMDPNNEKVGSPLVRQTQDHFSRIAVDYRDAEPEILTNLLENAAKYSADGTKIAVHVKSTDGGIEVSVKDEGMGISPDEVPKLFDRFYQARRARERRSGLGLGLFITKGFVEAHGGRIAVESIVDRGSTFRVWLPSTPPVDAHTAPAYP